MKNLLSLVTGLLVLTACAPSDPAPPEAAASTSSHVEGASATSFQAAKAWKHMTVFSAIGPRPPGSPGIEKTRRYLRKQLEACGATVREESFQHVEPRSGRDVRLTNVSGFIGDPDGPWVLIGTHYDTRPWANMESDPILVERPIVGMNDGGSGTAVLLELARAISERDPSLGLEVVFFDGEDLGRYGKSEEFCAGSRDLARRWTELRGERRPEAVYVIDMIGDRDLQVMREQNADVLHRDLSDGIWAAAARLGHGAHFSNKATGIYDDHSPFLEEGFRATLLIDPTYQPWHTQSDTIDKCSADSLGVIGEVVLEALWGTDGGVPPRP
jgi:glutaminyl-peptide cyclotransferase